MTKAEHEVRVDLEGEVSLQGTLVIPEGAAGVVLFAHGSGSSRFSPRNRFVAGVLQDGGLATLLVDLLTADEEAEERFTRHLRFDIDLLARRLLGARRWLRAQEVTAALPVGYFGSSTGAAAALVAAAEAPEGIGAVVSRGGRPDLAGAALRRVRAPTLLIVGGADEGVLELNAEALEQLDCQKGLTVVRGATHLFEEPGTLEEVAHLAQRWFLEHLAHRAPEPGVHAP